MKNKINIILEQQNKSMYWLSKVTGISYKNIHNLCNEDNPIKSIKLNTIDKICTALNCTPNDLFEPNIDLQTLIYMYQNNPSLNLEEKLRDVVRFEYNNLTEKEIDNLINLIPHSLEIKVSKSEIKLNLDPISYPHYRNLIPNSKDED